MKRVVVFGSTGSIGRAALEVIAHLKDEFRVFALAARTNVELLVKQVKRFKPKVVIINDQDKLSDLRKKLSSTPVSVSVGIDQMSEIACHPKVDIVIMAMSGTAGIFPIWAAIEKRKRIALATKEILVSFGKIVIEKAKHYDAEILPIDSEQVALHQCLNGNKLSEVKRVILTASGGPFRHHSNFYNIKLTDALNHPVWKMGKKVTIDSATLMNKGLEVIETVRLWSLSPKQVFVLIHPESVIHSMVEFIDGSILAQLAVPDMRLPIQYALTFPKRFPTLLTRYDFTKFCRLEFDLPDYKKFPCLKLAYQAIEKNNGYPCVLNAANEVAVAAFLNSRLKFYEIPQIIAKTLNAYKPKKTLNLTQLLNTDKWASEYAAELIRRKQL